MQLVDGQGSVRCRLMAAASNPSCWSELTWKQLGRKLRRWNDGLLLTGSSDQKPSPLTCIDRFEIERRSLNLHPRLSLA